MVINCKIRSVILKFFHVLNIIYLEYAKSALVILIYIKENAITLFLNVLSIIVLVVKNVIKATFYRILNVINIFKVVNNMMKMVVFHATILIVILYRIINA